ncbi:hypothetical protein [Cellulosilyticum lentocellum]|uniref:Na+-translocating membrane potential-generating system MpsC domain-containing protein n=1 Tax=Cellulosilyticum lentocellum (strain ATCC 49066 / DSM 5427 / NCIMB 11756 / RHM5) TaxID=642492 RepID=F2JKB4_CELLD|nr:hypothetical protein [Cellulosilyticum lentocellum]ADZ85629.1 hypothetical protein Clole_3951 [Cellulosilyticum lentocellum DSM 5427]
MIYEEKKLAKIVEELTIFFFGIGGNDISSRIQEINDTAIITFTSNYDLALAHKLDAMEDFLNREKNDSVEDVYWELVGLGEPGETSQLLLIGMMVDKASVHINENYVTIELEKAL